MRYLSLSLVMLSLLFPGALAQERERKSKLDNDPEIYYFDKPSLKDSLRLLVAKPTKVYRDKNGRSVLKTIKKGEFVTLVAMSDRAYRVKGGGKYDGFVGWVNPHHMGAKDPKFVENLKAFYKREMEVKALIAANEVALGMTQEEVGLSLGAPTKQTQRLTAEGKTTVLEYITYEEQKHYAYTRDPFTGQTYRTLSHVTKVETGKISVEFKDGLVIALESKEQQPNVSINRVDAPIIIRW